MGQGAAIRTTCGLGRVTASQLQRQAPGVQLRSPWRRAALNLDSTGAHAGLRVTRRSFHPESSVGSRLNPRLANDDDSARLRAITTRSSRRSAVRVARHRTIS